MKDPITSWAFAALLAFPIAASAQNAAPKADKPAASSTMNCPMMANMPGMMADMSGMQKDMGGMMSDMQAMMKDTKDPGMKERMQKMQGRMSAMMASMQKSGGMMGQMMGNGPMGRQPSGNTAPAKP